MRSDSQDKSSASFTTLYAEVYSTNLALRYFNSPFIYQETCYSEELEYEDMERLIPVNGGHFISLQHDGPKLNKLSISIAKISSTIIGNENDDSIVDVCSFNELIFTLNRKGTIFVYSLDQPSNLLFSIEPSSVQSATAIDVSGSLVCVVHSNGV